MKTSFAVLAIAGLAFTAAGCAKPEETKPAAPATTPATEPATAPATDAAPAATPAAPATPPAAN
jgi:hypothetical protein